MAALTLGPQFLAAPARAQSTAETEAKSPMAERNFKISLAGWSLHRAVFGGELKMIDVPRVMREELGIDGLEFVNTMMEVPTAGYVGQMLAQCGQYGITPVLIMCDAEGELGSPDAKAREAAVRNHRKWLWIAQDLGCKSIRVNWGGAQQSEQKDLAAAGELIARSAETMGTLADYGAECGLNVSIENHGGASSYPDMLVALMKAVDRPNFGTLPDFGNFPDDVDRYDATDRMMPYAKALSAKCHDFGEDGMETKIDFPRMIEICVDKHGYDGWIGIEYEGGRLTEREGILACKALLEKLRATA